MSVQLLRKEEILESLHLLAIEYEAGFHLHLELYRARACTLDERLPASLEKKVPVEEPLSAGGRQSFDLWVDGILGVHRKLRDVSAFQRLTRIAVVVECRIIVTIVVNYNDLASHGGVKLGYGID